ncbi:MAG: hypothetical protein U0805_14445 [Pirellulales bacterium]
MACPHLAELEQALAAAGIPETFRGRAWTSNCREWIYYACWLDRESIRARLPLAECVVDHDHLGTHDGQEAGFVCMACHDAIMGVHAAYRSRYPTFG